MVDLAALVASIKKHEGLRLFPYADTTGHITIGYGRNLTDRGITHDEAASLLERDIAECLQAAQKEPWWHAVSDNDARSRAMVELIFNLGASRLRTFVHSLAALERGDFETAADGFMNSLWARQVGTRSSTLTNMIRNGS